MRFGRACRSILESYVKGAMMSIPIKPIAAAAAPAGPELYQLASPSVVMAGVAEKLIAFVEYLGLVHRVMFNKPLVITSGKDSVHVASSLHAEGRAVDFRTKDLLPDEQQLILTLLAYAAPACKIAVFDERALGDQAHIHLEWHG